jgi:hypothetical protein
MSALPLKADMLGVEFNVRYVPIADILGGSFALEGHFCRHDRELAE